MRVPTAQRTQAGCCCDAERERCARAAACAVMTKRLAAKQKGFEVRGSGVMEWYEGMG